MKRQNGVALITVLLVVAVVTVVCAGLIARQQLSIRSSANQLHVTQAWHYAQGGETLAKAMLERDLRQGIRASRWTIRWSPGPGRWCSPWMKAVSCVFVSLTSVLASTSTAWCARGGPTSWR